MEAKPESKTAYPFGYLEQTSSGHFWTRRDDQLQALMDRTFAPLNEAWEDLPQALFVTNNTLVSLVYPEDSLAGSVIPSFVPQLLFGLVFEAPISAETVLTLRIAQDFNQNFLPDEGTESAFEGGFVEGDELVWRGEGEDYPIDIRDSTGDVISPLFLVKFMLMISPTRHLKLIHTFDGRSL